MKMLILFVIISLAGCKTLISDPVIPETLIPAPVIPDNIIPDHMIPEPIIQKIFIWQPEANHVVVTVPRDHWKYSVCTTTPAVNHHKALIDTSPAAGRRVEGGWEYILQGNGKEWRQRAINLDPKGNGAVVFFVNLNTKDPITGNSATHWVVPDPRLKYEDK